MLLVASETGHVYTFATEKLQPMITSEAGKSLIQSCLSYGVSGPDGAGGNGSGVSGSGVGIGAGVGGESGVQAGEFSDNPNNRMTANVAGCGSVDAGRISIENFQQFDYYGEEDDEDEDEDEDDDDDDEEEDDDDDVLNENDDVNNSNSDSNHFTENNVHSNVCFSLLGFYFIEVLGICRLYSF